MSDIDTISLCSSPRGLVQGALANGGAIALKWLEAQDPAWVRLGGPTFVAAPALVCDPQGGLWVFARDAEGVTHANVRRDDTGWSGWMSLGGTITDGPSASLDKGGRVVVFGRGTDGAVWHQWLDGERWSGWHSLGGGIKYAPAAVLTAGGRLTVFAVGLDDGLWHRYYDGGWSDWSSLEGKLTSSPAAAVDGVGMLHVFGRGTDNALWRRCHDLGWQPWKGLGGGLASSPAAAADLGGRLHVRVVGTDGLLIHERTAITAFADYAAVDQRPLSLPDPDLEERELRARREALMARPDVQLAAEIIVDVARLMFARGVAAARDPSRFGALDKIEARLAKRLAQKPPEEQERLAQAAEAELARFDEMQRAKPSVWGQISLRAAVPLADQIPIAVRGSGLTVMQPGVKLPGPVIKIKPRFRPQGGATMEFRIHQVYCDVETDEIGDDTLSMGGFVRAPGGQAVAFGPHDLGDFSDTDGPDERKRDFDVTDSRASFRWPNAAPGHRDNPYIVSLTLVEVDSDLDPEFMEGITRLVDMVSGLLAGTGPWGVAGAALLQLAWLGVGKWWKEKMKDEVAPALIFEGWAGMAGANTPRTTWMEWDGGRYKVTYSWSPPDLFATLDLSKFPPLPPAREKEFTLLDPGPFTEIGAAVIGDRFGLWARRQDGTVLFRDNPNGAFSPVAGNPASWVDDGWAVVEGRAGRFNANDRTYDARMSRGTDSFTNILRFSRVAGAGSAAWGIAGGKVYRYAGQQGKSAASAFGVPEMPEWRWDPIPTDAELADLAVSHGVATPKVWAIGTNGAPYEYSNAFLPRPASFPLASLCVSEASPVLGVSRAGQTYIWTGSAWEGYLCYELRNGSKVPLVTRQLKAVGRFGSYLSRHFLLTATGRLYQGPGSYLA